jgi:hypothetical protein
MDMASSGQMGQPAAIKMEYMNGIFMQIQKSPKKSRWLYCIRCHGPIGALAFFRLVDNSVQNFMQRPS